MIVDSKLLNSCHKLLETEISTILLSKNSLVTWFIIVPDTHHIEWYELDLDFQRDLNKQINIISNLLKQHFDVDKINIATIGNVVSQMHLHVVGRKKTDPFWPDVVWGEKESKEYREDQLSDIFALIKDSFLEIS